MQIQVIKQGITEVSADVWIVNLFAGVTKPGGATGAVDRACGGQISRLAQLGEFTGELLETAVLYPQGLPVKKIVVVGLGQPELFTIDKVRQVAGQAWREAAKGCGKKIATIVHGAGIGGLCPEMCAQAAVEGTLLAAYQYNKSSEAEQELLIVEHNQDKIATLERGAQRGQVIAVANNLARDLVNTPANLMTPTHMADVAQQVAQAAQLQCDILERADIERLGMGCLLGVAQGSQQPPKMIVLRYEGNPGGQTLALVGKGITFDSGGISLKSRDGMFRMKNDMAGGAAVLGAMSAIGQLKPRLNVLGVVPCTENLPSGSALKPGDVVQSMTGKTVEIISTDAEGRLILADAVAYAEQQGAQTIIDVATLTGACRAALGSVFAGLVSNDDALVEVITATQDTTGELYWRLPIHDDYREGYKSDVADIKNSGSAGAGTIVGGMFIQEFVDKAKWAHLDIASMAWTEKAKGYEAKGATGFATRTLIEAVHQLAQK